MPKKKRLFVDNGRPHGTVVLNWRETPEQEFALFAEAFRVLAQDSVKSLKQNEHFGEHGIPIEDFRAYPVIFLYRHALELYMKAVLLVGAPMLSILGKTPIDREHVLKTHSLDVLRQHLENVFDVYGWEWDLGTPHFHNVQDLRDVIGEFHSVDAGSYAFRYPVDTKGAAALNANFKFNVFEFFEILDELFPTLEGAAIGAHEELQATLEMMAENEQYARENADYGYEQRAYEDEYRGDEGD